MPFCSSASSAHFRAISINVSLGGPAGTIFARFKHSRVKCRYCSVCINQTSRGPRKGANTPLTRRVPSPLCRHADQLSSLLSLVPLGPPLLQPLLLVVLGNESWNFLVFKIGIILGHRLRQNGSELEFRREPGIILLGSPSA